MKPSRFEIKSQFITVYYCNFALKKYLPANIKPCTPSLHSTAVYLQIPAWPSPLSFPESHVLRSLITSIRYKSFYCLGKSSTCQILHSFTSIHGVIQCLPQIQEFHTGSQATVKSFSSSTPILLETMRL